MKTKRTWLSLLLVAVMLACLAVPAFAADTDTDPYADVTPGRLNFGQNNLPSANNTTGTDDAVQYYRTFVDRAVDYNNTITYTFAGQYTFSFSVKAEEGVPLAPLNFRERGNADVNILKIGSDGIVYAYGFESSESNKSAISVSGVVINTETWTNITLCVDRTNYTVTYYINGEQTYSRTYSDTWVLAANSTYETTKINQWPGTVNGSAENPLVVLHGNYSFHAGAVSAEDHEYFAKAFPNLSSIKFIGVSGTVGTDLSMTFSFLLANDCADAKVRVTRCGKIETLTPVKTEGGIAFTAGGKTYEEYTVVYAGIGPHNMTDKILTEIVQGEDVLASATTSFRDYCETVLKNYAANTEMVNLVNRLLAYGAEAQKYLGYNTGDLPVPHTNVVAYEDFTGNPTLNMRGWETGTAQSIASDTPGKVWRIVGSAKYLQVFVDNVFADLVSGKSYVLSLRYKVVNTQSGNPGSFRIGNGDTGSGKNRNMDKELGVIQAKSVGVWESAQISFTYNPTSTDYDDLCINVNGCGHDKTQAVYEIRVTDIIVMEVEDPAAVPAEVNVKEVSDPATITGANVIFDTQNRIRFTISADALGEGVTVTLNGTPVTPGQGEDGKYYVETEALSPLAYNTVFTLKVGDVTAKYSLNSYAYRMQDNASIGALVRATYAYGVAAEAYKNAQ